jgi:hypothetical protein
MPSVPHRFQEGTDFNGSRPLLNDNFDKISDYINSQAVNTTNSTTVTSTVAATSTSNTTVVVLNPGATSTYAYINTPLTVKTLGIIQPQIDVYVDVDNNANNLLPNGSSLTAAQKNASVRASIDSTPVAGVGSLTINVRNNDSASHTYYVHIKCAYLQSTLNT